MSDDQDPSQKTEDPTSKRMADSLKKGQVVTSQEVSSWFMIAVGTAVVAIFAPGMMTGVRQTVTKFLAQPHNIPMDAANLWQTMIAMGSDIFSILLVPVILFLTAAIASNLVQHPLVFSTQKLIPKPGKLSPIEGAKNKFSLKQIVEFAKGLIKVSLVGAVAGALIWPRRDTLPQLMTIDLKGVLLQIQDHIVTMLIAVVAVMAVVAFIDYLYQKYEHIKKLKMTKQEVKDEAKDSDGDPKIKARLRQIRMERQRQRMMAAVPEATVVVTNPTHFAVAMKYEGDEMDAPIVVAKGADETALRIRELAEQHDVPIVENPPLARALFASAELEQEIPIEHYQAVAEVIGYVMGLKNAGNPAQRATA